MIKREMKVNLSSFLIWFIVLAGIFLIVYLVYPAIIATNNIGEIDEMMKLFPPEVLKAFNMDISSMDSAFGWLKSEGFVFVLLIIGCYAGVMGSNILLKEESDGTIEYLNSLPVRRKDIVVSKSLVGLIYVVLMVLGIGVFNFIGLFFSGEFSYKIYFLMSITPLFSSIVIYFLCLFISTFFSKCKKMLGVSLGVVMLSYILNTLAVLSSDIEFLKYVSVFTLADIRNVIVDGRINPLMVMISIGLSVVLFSLTLSRYEKKELI